MKTFLRILWPAVIGLSLMITACAGDPGGDGGESPAARPETPAAVPEDNETRIRDMNTAAQQANHFAMRFYGRVAAEQPGNLFFSPLSIHAALSMTYAGARGETATEMQKVLAFEYAPEEGIEHAAYSQLLTALNEPPVTRLEAIVNDRHEEIERPVYELVIANRLWGQQGFSWDSGYLRLTQTEYHAALAEVDFEGDAESARREINDWIEDTTRNRIRNLIPAGALDALTRLVLTNAIYFKANWAEEFSEHQTRPAPFHLAGGDIVEVPLMHQTEDFAYTEGDGWQALEMPYESGALSMLLMLPADRDGALPNVEAKLASGAMLDALGEMARHKVRVWLPKFSMTQEIDLGATLQSMGITRAFSDRADFSGMVGEEDLTISKALHKAFVEVDEKGTEAAAATAIVVALTAMPGEPEEPKVFRADRPFLFLIRHNASGAILFAGRMTDPR